MSYLPHIAAILIPLGICAPLVWAFCSHMKFSVEHAEIRVRLFRFTLKRVAFTDIEFADQTWCWWNEHYSNTFNPKRIVRIRRHSGWCRNLIITPPNPEIFLSELALHGVDVR